MSKSISFTADPWSPQLLQRRTRCCPVETLTGSRHRGQVRLDNSALRIHRTCCPAQRLMFHQIQHPRCNSRPIRRPPKTPNRRPMRKPPNLSLHPHDQHQYNSNRTPPTHPITSHRCTTTATIPSSRIFSNSPSATPRPRPQENPSCHPWHR